MRLFEFDSPLDQTPQPDQLMGLVSFLAGRAEDTDAQKQIDQNTFIELSRNLGINLNKDMLVSLTNQPPLSNVLEPFDPNSGVITFKGAEQTPTAMPVNKAQDIVAAAAKSAAKKDRSI